MSTCRNLTVQKTTTHKISPPFNHAIFLKLMLSGILQQRIELDKECMFQYTQLRKEVRMMDGQTSVAPVLMRFQRGCQQVRPSIFLAEIFSGVKLFF